MTGAYERLIEYLVDVYPVTIAVLAILGFGWYLTQKVNSNARDVVLKAHEHERAAWKDHAHDLRDQVNWLRQRVERKSDGS